MFFYGSLIYLQLTYTCYPDIWENFDIFFNSIKSKNFNLTFKKPIITKKNDLKINMLCKPQASVEFLRLISIVITNSQTKKLTNKVTYNPCNRVISRGKCKWIKVIDL